MDALDHLDALIADGYAAGRTTPEDAGHVVTVSGGRAYAVAYITHGDGGTRVAVEDDDDQPTAYRVRGTRMSRRDAVRAIATLA